MSNIFKTAGSAYLSFQFIKLLTMPWEDWEAYKDGVIDKDGNTIKDHPESDSWNRIIILVRNIKQIIEKVPFIGKSTVLRFASALWLIKEETGTDLTDVLFEHCNVTYSDFDIINEEVIEGPYFYRDSLITLENTTPVGHMLGQPIYETTNMFTKEKEFISSLEMEII